MAIKRRGGTQWYSTLRPIQTPRGLKPLPDILKELDSYVEVLAGDVEPPWENGILTLHELADSYYARAREIEGRIYRGERDGWKKDDPLEEKWPKFRTGELQSYLGIFRHAAELGSRRVTAAKEFRDELDV